MVCKACEQVNVIDHDDMGIESKAHDAWELPTMIHQANWAVLVIAANWFTIFPPCKMICSGKPGRSNMGDRL